MKLTKKLSTLILIMTFIMVFGCSPVLAESMPKTVKITSYGKVAFDYDSKGNLVGSYNPSKRTSCSCEYKYDGNKKIAFIDNKGWIRGAKYDSKGRIDSYSIDPVKMISETRHFTYKKGRLTRATVYANNHYIGNSGNVIWAKGTIKVKVKYKYKKGKLKKITITEKPVKYSSKFKKGYYDAYNTRTVYYFNKKGLVKKATRDGHTTRYQYKYKNGVICSITNSDNWKWKLAYSGQKVSHDQYMAAIYSTYNDDFLYTALTNDVTHVIPVSAVLY